MSTASCTRTSQIMSNVSKGTYVNNTRFHNYGSVVEDSIVSQQRWAYQRLAEIRRNKKKNKKNN